MSTTLIIGGLASPLLITEGYGAAPSLPVTDYTLDGPTSGPVGIASSDFTVTLGTGPLASPVTITPDDDGDGGSFTPTSITLTDSSRSATFTYTAASVGVKTISVTNDDDLVDPSPITYTALPSGSNRIGHVTPTRGGR